MNWFRYLIAIIAGALLPLAFAPLDFFPLAILSPAILLFLWSSASPRQAFAQGGLFGLGFFGVGVSWVYVSLHTFGEANFLLAGILTTLMVMVLAAYPALQGYLLTRFFPHNNLSKYLLAFPSSWVLAEWVRTWLLTGFPWLFLGYSQMNTPLRGLAPLLSVYGVSWLVAFTSGALITIVLAKKRYPLIGFTLLCTAFLWVSSFVLTFIQWTTPHGNSLKVSLIQGNILQTLKWQPSQTAATLALYQHLTQQHLDSDIIVWPEAAITISPNQAKNYLVHLDQTLKSHHSTLISGIPIAIGDRYYNGVIAIGDGTGTYRKRHLVPFGEYIPFRSLLVWLRHHLQIPMSDFSSGPSYQPLLLANNIPIATYICYEIAYPIEVLDGLPQGQLLVTVSDDSWFGRSMAPAQHLQIAQMRALETGRYLLMSTNDGLTGIINPQGNINAVVPRYQEIVLTGEVRAMTGSTPWTRMSSIYPLLALLLLFLLWAFIRQKNWKLF